MDETRQPGIEFAKLALLELNYKWNDEFTLTGMPLSYEITSDYVPGLTADGKTLDARLGLKIKSDALTLSLVLSGIFKEGTQPNLSLEKFAMMQAPALVIPFAREVVYNITARSPIPPLILPPINVKALTEESLKSKRKPTKKPAKKKSLQAKSAKKKPAVQKSLSRNPKKK